MLNFESCCYGQLSHYPISPLESVSLPDVRVSEVSVSQLEPVVRMVAPLCCLSALLVSVASVQGSEQAMTELKQNIFYHYDMNVIPQEVSADMSRLKSWETFDIDTFQNGTESDPLSVHLGVAPTWVDLDSNGVMTIIMWLKLSWRDHRLAWDPDNYDEVSVLR